MTELPPGDGLDCGGTAACGLSSECAVGEICLGGCCAPAPGVTPQCAAAGGSACFTFEDLCRDSEAGCACAVLDGAGQTVPGRRPILHLAEGAQRSLQALLWDVESGVEIHDAAFSIAAPDLVAGAPVRFDGAVVIGTDVPGTVQVEVRFGRAATCSAEIRNLGAAPAEGLYRVLVLDGRDGTPVAGAHVVLDGDGDGEDDGIAERTNADGVSTSSIALPNGADVTVFAAGFDYLTLAKIAPGDVVIPLTARPAEPEVGAATGTVDFTTYERIVRGGRAGSLSLAMVAASFPLEALARFDLALLLGGPLMQTDCTASSTVDEGCFALTLPSLGVEEEIGAWGGMVMDMPTLELKPSFAILGTPGRRRLWSVGGQWEVTELASLVREVLAGDAQTCDCGPGDAACKVTCVQSEPTMSVEGRFFRSIMPLLRASAFGVSRPVDLLAAPRSEWDAHLAVDYKSREIDPRFPVLDGSRPGTPGAIDLRNAARHHTVLRVPPLPDDPETGAPLEAYFVLSGVDALGAGFVPTGFGAGFDCTGERCPGRIRDPYAAGYDGIVDGVDDPGLECPADAAGCEPTAPRRIEDGSLPVVHTSDPTLHGRRRTVVLALPSDSFAGGALRASGVVVDASLPEGEVDWSALHLPALAAPEVSFVERRVWLGVGDATEGLLRVDVRGASVGWTVLSDSAAQVVAPKVPEGLADPFAGAQGARSTVYRLAQGMDLATLVHPAAREAFPAAREASNSGTTLADLGSYLTGFSTYER